MARFLVLYNSSKSAAEVMASSTPEQMKAGMDSWIEWRDGLNKEIKFDWGMPLQAMGHIDPEGISPSSSQVSGYSMIDGDKDEILEALKSHPQLKRSPGDSIDLLELLPMPGMEDPK